MAQNDDLRRRELAELYDRYNDTKLLNVAEEELTEVARSVLQEEIARRGLEKALEHHLSLNETHGGAGRVVVWTGRTMEEAAVVIHVLHLANIEAVLLLLQGTKPSERFQVNVAALNAENAIELIAVGISNTEAEVILEDFARAELMLPSCPACGSDKVKFEGSREGNCWSCDNCGNQWEEGPIGLSGSEAEGLAQQSKSLVDANEEVSRSRSKNKRRLVVNRLTVSFVLVASVLGIAAGWPAIWNSFMILGLVLWTGGLIPWTIARLQLGSSFTGRAEVHDLVTSGIYARIRNPIYISGAIVTTGMCFYFARHWALMFVLITIPIQVNRVRRERAVLTEAFGEEYAQYRRQTWF